MKQYPLSVILLIVIVLSAGSSSSAVFPLNGSKHDLSSAGTGSYKAVSGDGGTSEVCIFCHTPHSANTEAPLWNRRSYVASYVSYTSDVLAALNYPAAEDPSTGVAHSRTRICLSCHDGTIALGSVINMPASIPNTYTEIKMQAGYEKIKQESSGYIGLNLSDDHPVAIKHQTSGVAGDPELVSPIAGPEVKLYDANGSKVYTEGNYVECTSCHDPHDNSKGNFLVMENRNSALCLKCHAKSEFAASIHATASGVNDAYAPSDGTPGGTLGAYVGDVKCMNCHFPHKAGVTAAAPTAPNPQSGKYLLSFQEEASCFNDNDRWGQAGVTACHGNSANVTQRRIKPELSSTSRHNISSYAGKHASAEVKSGTLNGWFTASSWHVECEDCHNPHTAGNALHTQGSNTISSSSALYGVAYVSVAGVYPSGSWSSPLSYSPVEPLGATRSTTWGGTPVKEYEICFKCHSYFASGGGNFPNAYSSLQQMSDQSKEFNVNNSMGSFHPVVTGNSNPWGDMTGGWTTGTQLMYCSDCHTKENLSRPQGPHGSGNRYILSYPYYDDRAAKGSADDANGTLCLQCHNPNTYSSGGGTSTGFYTTGGTNLHTQHYSVRNNVLSAFAYRCVNCHIRTPHGWDRKGLIHMQGDNATHGNGNWYEPVSGATITGLTLPASRGYAHGNASKNVNCQTINGCHQ